MAVAPVFYNYEEGTLEQDPLMMLEDESYDDCAFLYCDNAAGIWHEDDYGPVLCKGYTRAIPITVKFYSKRQEKYLSFNSIDQANMENNVPKSIKNLKKFLRAHSEIRKIYIPKNGSWDILGDYMEKTHKEVMEDITAQIMRVIDEVNEKRVKVVDPALVVVEKPSEIVAVQDTDPLLAQIEALKAENEALKAENEALKAEHQVLKANGFDSTNLDKARYLNQRISTLLKDMSEVQKIKDIADTRPGGNYSTESAPTMSCSENSENLATIKF